ALVQPLLGLPHWAGVVMVGAVVVFIVATAGMVSTTYVQFIKGGLLVLFSAALTVMILHRGLVADPNPAEAQTVTVTAEGRKLVNGKPQGTGPGEADLRPVGHVSRLPGGVSATGPLGPLEYLAAVQGSEVVLWGQK